MLTRAADLRQLFYTANEKITQSGQEGILKTSFGRSKTSIHLRNEFNFWNVHGIMNTSGLRASLTLHETRSIHDSMNIPKIEFITYIYIIYYQPSINFHLTWLVFQIF